MNGPPPPERQGSLPSTPPQAVAQRPSGLSSLHPLLFLLVVLLVGRHLVLLLRVLTITHPIDLGTYYLHTRMLWERADPTDFAQLSLYGERLGFRPLRGVNPPTFYLLFLPFALLPWTVTRVIWLLLSEVALGGIGWIVWTELRQRGVDGVASALVVAGFVSVFYPVQQTLALGQVDIFLGLVLAVMSVTLAKEQKTVAGILALVTGCIKLQLGAIAVLFILSGRAQRGMWAILAFGGLWLGGVIAVFGLQAVTLYLQYIITVLDRGLEPNELNYSLNGLLGRVLLPRVERSIAEATYAVLAGAVTVVSLRVIFCCRNPGALGLWLWVGFLPLTVWLISPLSEEHHLAWIIAPLLISCVEWAPRVSFMQAALFILAAVLMGVQHYPHSVWTGTDLGSELLRSSKLLGPALLWALSAWALLRSDMCQSGRGRRGLLKFS